MSLEKNFIIRPLALRIDDFGFAKTREFLWWILEDVVALFAELVGTTQSVIARLKD
jgi:hypothetical protein